jgi:hypothetical protein
MASVGKDVEILEFLSTAGRNVEWYNHFGLQSENFSII